MTMRIKRVLYSVVASCALAGALYVPARAAGLNIETATIADVNAAFADGTLTSEQLVKAYLKRIEAYDKKGPVINAIITLSEKALDEARQRDAERKSGNVRGPLHGSRWRTGYEAGTEGYFVADRCGCQGATGVTI